MVYVTLKQPPHFHQMTLDEFLFGANPNLTTIINPNETNTRTWELEELSLTFRSKVSIVPIITALEDFNRRTEYLHNVDRRSLYSEFYIPKKSGGLRKIDAPNEELKEALRSLKSIFETKCHALYHTSAFAYIKKRCTIDSIKRHQANESKWFAKFDLSNFFGSTTKEFVMQQFSMVFPFSEVIKDHHGKEELEYALDLAFLDGGLPQGTPISPIITNIMMIPIDFKLCNSFRNFEFTDRLGECAKNYCVYTRYADDFLVSSRYDFNFLEAQQKIIDVLKMFNAPFTIKKEKTRYGSSAGANWNLGVMLNKDNKITVGHKKKRRLFAMVSSYIMDRNNGIRWDVNDIQVMGGIISYCKMVEGDAIDEVISHLSEKFGVDIYAAIKADLTT